MISVWPHALLREDASIGVKKLLGGATGMVPPKAESSTESRAAKSSLGISTAPF